MILIWLRQGIAYGIISVGWVLAFGVGAMVLCTLAAALTALGDWLNERGKHGKPKTKGSRGV
jgi:hypothetical protein